MGLFYTALQRADKKPEPDADQTPAAPPAPASPALVRNWEEAAERDLAGYPLVNAAPPAVPQPAAPQTLDPQAAGEPVVWDAASLGAAANPSGAAREQYRILRTRLLEAMHSRNLRSLLISSAIPGEGKTLVAANLALQFSELGERRVLLIDADLRRAGLSSSLRPLPPAGLCDYLKGEAGLPEVLCEMNPWLTILPTRRTQEVAPELLSSQSMVELLQRMRADYDLILIDGAPVGPVADSRILARLVDAALLVVRTRTAASDDVEQAAELLRPRLLGSVLNGADEDRRHHYSYYGEDDPPAATPGSDQANQEPS